MDGSGVRDPHRRMFGRAPRVVVHVDAAVLMDPAQPGQSVMEEGSHVPAEPAMWRSPLPMRMKLSTIAVEEFRGR